MIIIKVRQAVADLRASTILLLLSCLFSVAGCYVMLYLKLNRNVYPC